MKVSLVTSVPLVPPWDQGDKNLAYALTQVLPAIRFQVLTARDAPPPAGTNLELLPFYRNTVPSLMQKAAVFWSFLRQPAPARPALYHFIYRPYPLSSHLARLIPAFRQRPTLHTVPATASGQPLTRDLFFADRLVALSRHGQRQLEALGLENVDHIPTAVDVRIWAEVGAQSARWKAELGLNGHPTLLFPSHYGPGYGADVMLAALPQIAAAIPDVRVLFACRPRHAEDGAREAAAKQALAAAGLADNARFFSTVSDMRRLIGAADLTLLPLETMRDKVDIPTTLLESLAAAKPTVISDLAPMNELFDVGGEEMGYRVPPGDAAALAEATVRLLQDAPLRTRQGHCGQTFIQKRHDIRVVARHYADLYREMIS
jgi:glycosyltransferase involved in cell wall biosynthesis